MKPCSKNRKLIAWLALDALEVRQAQDLRAHLESCEGCRRYWEEVSKVTETLAAAGPTPAIQASESFHRRVVEKLRAEESGSFWEAVVARGRTFRLNWRVALPVIGATAVVIATLAVLVRHSGAPLPGPTGQQVVQAPKASSDLDPTISNYQMVANQSLEKLDELLTRQGTRNPPPALTYTASALSHTTAPD